jgi:hypothetical protein
MATRRRGGAFSASRAKAGSARQAPAARRKKERALGERVDERADSVAAILGRVDDAAYLGAVGVAYFGSGGVA